MPELKLERMLEEPDEIDRLVSDQREEEEVIDDINARIEADLRAETGDAVDQVTWTVRGYRVTGKARDGAKEPVLFDIVPAEIQQRSLIERFRDFGTGLYRVRAFKNGRMKFQNTIAIEMAPVAAASAAPVANDNALMLLAQQMQRQNELMLQIINRPTPAPVDPINQLSGLKDMMGIVTGMMTAMSTGAAAKTTESAISNFTEMMKFVKTLREDVEPSGGGSEEGGLMGLLGKLANSKLGEVLAEQLASQTRAAPPQQIPARDVPNNRVPNNRAPNNGNRNNANRADRYGPQKPFKEPETPPGPSRRMGVVEQRQPQPIRTGQNEMRSNETPNTMNGHDMKTTERNATLMETMAQHPVAAELFTKNILYLLDRAKNERDPELYAEWFLDNIPDDMFDEIAPLIEDETLVDNIIRALPDVGPYRTWFETCRLAMVKFLAESETQAPGTDDVEHDGVTGDDPGRGGRHQTNA